MARINPERTAVRRQFLDVEQSQTVRREDFLGCQERKIGEMLVIDRVELVLFHQAHQVRKFHRDHARAA